MNAADQRAIDRGLDGFGLMQAAGAAVAAAVEARWSARPITVLCGPGNNGGDGFVAACALRSTGWPVRVALLGTLGALSKDAAQAAALWNAPVEPLTPSCLEGAEVVIDALFGAGLSRPVEGDALRLVEALQAAAAPVCAVDVPSGVNGSTGVVWGAAAPADLTVTFFRKKPGHLLYPGRQLCGDVILADIGIPASCLPEDAAMTWENDPQLWRDDYPWPQPEGFKFARGHLLVLGGPVMTGASRLTALAAARAGGIAHHMGHSAHPERTGAGGFKARALLHNRRLDALEPIAERVVRLGQLLAGGVLHLGSVLPDVLLPADEPRIQLLPASLQGLELRLGLLAEQVRLQLRLVPRLSRGLPRLVNSILHVLACLLDRRFSFSSRVSNRITCLGHIKLV